MWNDSSPLTILVIWSYSESSRLFLSDFLVRKKNGHGFACLDFASYVAAELISILEHVGYFLMKEVGFCLFVAL